jgi:5'(3')-deoxyribonucleotidase
MRVALDLEDVLVENVRNFLGELNSYVEENHSSERRFRASDVEGWKFKGLREDFAEIQGWNSDITEKFMFGDGNGWKGFYPVTEMMWREKPSSFRKTEENLSEKVKRLSRIAENQEGYLSIVTARENVRPSIEKRVRQLGIKESVEEVIVERDKQDLDFDVFIDDNPGLHQKMDEGIQIILSQPWNENESLGKKHSRVNGLSEAVEVMKNLD